MRRRHPTDKPRPEAGATAAPPSNAHPIRVPFTRSVVMGRELEYVAEAVNGRHLTGDGPFTKRCSDWLTRRLGAAETLLTTSCTHALEMSALLLDIKPGDEVIVPAFTFVSTINPFVLRGATPVFIDSRPDTLNLDETKLERLITKRTRAIVPVHYAGVGCEMDMIGAIAAGHGVSVVEDNAHGLFGKYRGRSLGTFGSLAALSFHGTKNVVCGEGGALVINDPRYVEQAEIIREKGTNRSRFFRGQVDKYTWVGIGSSYLPSDLLAAFLLGQLECETTIQERRRAIWQTYDRELVQWAETQGIRRPVVPDHCDQSWHMYYLLMPDLASRTRLMAHLRQSGILAVFHYLPLHQSEMARTLRSAPPSLPVAESVSDRLLRLPLYNDMDEADLGFVLDSLRSWSA